MEYIITLVSDKWTLPLWITLHNFYVIKLIITTELINPKKFMNACLLNDILSLSDLFLLKDVLICLHNPMTRLSMLWQKYCRKKNTIFFFGRSKVLIQLSIFYNVVQVHFSYSLKRVIVFVTQVCDGFSWKKTVWYPNFMSDISIFSRVVDF